MAAAQSLPETLPLEWEEADFSGRLMDGAYRFVERKISETPEKCASLWSRDFSSVDACRASVAANREHLRIILGAVDRRLPAAMERYGDDANPALVAETTMWCWMCFPKCPHGDCSCFPRTFSQGSDAPSSSASMGAMACRAI